MTATLPVNDESTVRKLGLLSVVVPCFNEEDVILETLRQLNETLGSSLSLPYELVFVDDGSRDATLLLLTKAAQTDPRIRAISFSRNFGHQAAVTAGLKFARGDAIVMIDADLQDPPAVIPRMVAAWERGYDVVYGVRAVRKGETAFKRFSAAMFYRMLQSMSDVEIPVDTGDFRLIDRRVVEVLGSMPERDRFLRGMIAWAGYRQIGLPYEREARFAGESKYPLRKMIKFAIDGVSSFSIGPLRLAIWLGFAAATLSVAMIIYAVIVRLTTDSWVPGWAALFVAVMFMGGVQLLAIGVIGEYVGRLFVQAKARPLFLVDQVIEGSTVVRGSVHAVAGETQHVA